MGGMALGIGLIVLLVSIGYGLEHLVINRVARLEELRQADIVPGLTDELALTDQTISNFQQISGISEVIPVISAVGKVNYNNSQSDMAVYGVTSNYLEESAIKPSHGKIFESNDLTANIYSADPPSPESRPAGLGPFSINYDLADGFWYRVRAEPDPASEVIG
jgi:ABC-type lipoprotein release transport system permease subunit